MSLFCQENDVVEIDFIENAFDMRESRRQITDPLDRAFIVPMRSSPNSGF